MNSNVEFLNWTLLLYSNELYTYVSDTTISVSAVIIMMVGYR